MKRVIVFIVMLATPLLLLSQEVIKYEYTPKVKKQIEINDLLGKITFKNSGNNAIVIESDYKMEKPDRAEGLKPLGALEDNTGLGISVTEENGVVRINGATKKVKDFEYTLSIPDGIAVQIDYSSPFASDDLEIDSYKGSLEIKTLNAGVKLKNSSGPFTVNSISGDVEAVFSNLDMNEPTSLATVSGLIDVSLPGNLKANISLSSITGDIYNNHELSPVSKKDKDQRAEGMEEIKHSGGNEFLMNGGGQKLFLKSVSGNIYLRKN